MGSFAAGKEKLYLDILTGGRHKSGEESLVEM